MRLYCLILFIAAKIVKMMNIKIACDALNPLFIFNLSMQITKSAVEIIAIKYVKNLFCLDCSLK